jgi:hypothetical protein
MWPKGRPRALCAAEEARSGADRPSSREQESHAMSQNYERLVQVVNDARVDLEKAEAGNKAATSRVRKAMQDVKNIAQDIRKEMLEVRDAGGAKT